jgi:hypothetical protein
MLGVSTLKYEYTPDGKKKKKLHNDFQRSVRQTCHEKAMKGLAEGEGSISRL